jgi:serine/threonine-protein kinase
VAAVAALGLIAVVGWATSRPTLPLHIERYGFTAVTPEQLALTPIELGPDGTGMIYWGLNEGGGGFQLWYRRFDDLQATVVPNSGAATDPAISPDGSEVAFSRGGEIWVVPLAGGVPRTIADSAVCCPSWGPDGEFVYFVRAPNGAARVPRTGGAHEIVVEGTRGAPLRFFNVTPSGRTGLYTLFGNPVVTEAIDFDTGERTILTEGVMAHATTTGHLLFATLGGELLAAPYREGPMRLTGAAVPLIDGVFVTGNGTPRYSLNEQGTLAYWEGEGDAGAELVWVSREGAATIIDEGWRFDPGGGNRGWALSPDGSRVAIRIVTDAGIDIWIKELDDGPFARLTFWEGEDRDPNWTADSRAVTFLSAMPIEGDSVPAPGGMNLWRQVSDGSRPAELLYDHGVSISEAVLSPDGSSAVVRSTGVSGVQGGRDIYTVDLAGDSEPVAILATEFDESAPKLSPDGRWLAYQSNESGRDQVYVRPYPDTDRARILISTDGGLAPRWSRDGSELFYLSGSREMMSAALSITGDELRVADRTRLFELAAGMLVGDRTTQYDVAADGRFLMLRTVSGEADESRMVIVRNFFEEMKARVGSGG